MQYFALWPLIFFLITFNAHAIGFDDAVYPEIITSARAQAMGNAFVSKVDDEYSAFYNPAGLGSVRHGHFHLTNLHVESNDGFVNLVGEGSGMQSLIKNSANATSIDGIREMLVNNRGTMAHARIQTFPNITFRYLTLGFGASKTTKVGLEDITGSQLEYADRTDLGPVSALNMSLFGGIIKIGGSAMYLTRREITGTANPNATVEVKSDQYRKGTMLLVNGGAKLTLPIVFLPTFAATLHNATSQPFADKGGPQELDKIRQTIDAGFSLTPIVGRNTRVHLEANIKDYGDKYGVDSDRRFAGGIELDFNRTFYIRGGYGDGYGSGGIGLNTRMLQIDLSTYAAKTKWNSGTEFVDRRYVGSIALGF